MRRTIKPTLRSPVEYEPTRSFEDALDIADAAIADNERASHVAGSEQATAIVRAFRCPSHGRNQRAEVTYTEGGWAITGLCCDRATAAVRAELDD